MIKKTRFQKRKVKGNRILSLSLRQKSKSPFQKRGHEAPKRSSKPATPPPPTPKSPPSPLPPPLSPRSPPPPRWCCVCCAFHLPEAIASESSLSNSRMKAFQPASVRSASGRAAPGAEPGTTGGGYAAAGLVLVSCGGGVTDEEDGGFFAAVVAFAEGVFVPEGSSLLIAAACFFLPLSSLESGCEAGSESDEDESESLPTFC